MRKKAPTWGGYFGEVAEALNFRLASGPSRSWLEAYNLKALEERLGLEPNIPLAAELFPPTPLIFTPVMPSVFFDHEPGKIYRGNHLAKERVDKRIQALDTNDRFKCLLTGPAGGGKTAFAWITAYRIMTKRARLGRPVGRFFEVLGGQIEGKEQWDIFMKQLREYDTVFIDEIHDLNRTINVESLYPVLADTGVPRYPLGAGNGWIDLPDAVSWIGATTEPGMLDKTNGGALRRRLEPEIRIEPPNLEELAGIVQDQDIPVDNNAAMQIALRSGGLPWQAIVIYDEAKVMAKSVGLKEIKEEQALEAFKTIGVDENGLLPEDRSVLKALLKTHHQMANGKIVHRMNESALCAAAGVDSSTYKTRIQPKLQGRLQLITTVGGQTATEKAVELYGHLMNNV